MLEAIPRLLPSLHLTVEKNQGTGLNVVSGSGARQDQYMIGTSNTVCATHKMRPHAYVDLTYSLFIQFWP